jgi:hypothetical protein
MDEDQQDAQQEPVSEAQEVVGTEEQHAEARTDSPRTVPLEALEAERRKRQDLEAQNRALQELMTKSKAPEKTEEEDDDEDEFITKAEMKQRLSKISFAQKREMLEEAFCDSKPEAVELINTHLEQIIKRKPWLAQTIESAPNRYARAYEIVQDYMPKDEKVAPSSKFARPKDEARKIVENAQKPGNPATIAKAANSSNMDYLKSIQGKPEFREYRRKMLARG